jgi:hypothetical protein
MSSARRSHAPAVLLLATLGCEGSLFSPTGPATDGPPIDSDGSPSTDGPDGEEQGPCLPTLPSRLVLLSDYQQANAIRSLLGEAALEAEAALNAQTKPFTQKGVVVNASLVHGRQGWAGQAAESVEARFSEVTGCASDDSDECARTFIGKFAAQAFRRPVDGAEIDDLMGVYAVGKATSFVAGVTRMVEAVLSSPSFMYRSELGHSDGAGNLVLQPEELATTLSFLLTDAPPDAELLEAAQSGHLDSAEQVSAQVERLLDTPTAQASLVSTIMAAWSVSNLFGTVKDPTLFPDYGPGMQASMFKETELFLHNLLFAENAPLPELLTSRQSFVNPRLAELYGISYPGDGDDFVEVTLPAERSGVFTQASLLTMLARTDNTSVVARGLFVRGALLCLPKVPSPPAELTDAIEELLAADMTERERAEVRATTQPCGGCHAAFDGFGLMVENFDPVGRARAEVGGEPVDTSVDLMQPMNLAGKYPDITAFAESAAQSAEFTSCVATNLLRYALNDDSLKAESCQVRAALATLADEPPTLRQLVHAVVASPAFRTRKAGEP